MDWHDMLSDEEKEHYKASDSSEEVMDDDYVTVDVVVLDVGYN